MKFFLDLLTDGSGLSSKRFISIIGMFVLVGVIVLVACKIVIPDIIIIALVTVILGNGALTLAGKSPKE